MTARVVMSRFGTKAAIAGIAIVSACAVGIAPSVQPPPPAVPPIQMAAAASRTAAQPLAQPTNVLGSLFSLDLSRFIIPPSASQPFPTPEFLPQVTPTSTGSTIKYIYNAVEPWVR